MEKSALVSLDDVKKTCDGWIYLSEKCPVFVEKVQKFLNEAASYVRTDSFNVLGSENNNTEVVNLETYTYGAKEVVLSFVSKPKDREDYCQFIQFKRIKFSLNKDGNLAINEMSGRCETNLGYKFDNAKSGKIITEYSYNEFTPEGIELLYRSYTDENEHDDIKYFNCRNNLRGCVMGGYNPRLDEYSGKELRTNIQTSPKFTEKSRSIKNLGLVKVVSSSFDANGNPVDKVENECINTFWGTKEEANPYLIYINKGIPPICEHKGDKKIVNYRVEGASLSNYPEVARSVFCSDVNRRRKSLIAAKEDGVLLNHVSIDELLEKYDHLYELEGLDKWIWKDLPNGERSTRK